MLPVMLVKMAFLGQLIDEWGTTPERAY